MKTKHSLKAKVLDLYRKSNLNVETNLITINSQRAEAIKKT